MKTITQAAFTILLFAAALTATAQSPAKMTTSKTSLVVDGKWMASSYDYDSQSGEYYFVVKGKPVVFDDYFKMSTDYLVNTIYAQMITITYNGKKYEKYGLPRVLQFDEVKPVGKYNGVLVMAETGIKAAFPEVIYIPYEASMGNVAFNVYNLKKQKL